MNRLINTKTKPFGHQQKHFNKWCDKENEAMFWDMGTGKTKVCIDKAVYLYDKGEIEALVFLAPNGVHSDHINNAVPDHSGVETRRLVFNPSTGKKVSAINENFLKPSRFLKCISFTTDSARTGTKANVYLNTFIENHKVLLCVDESSDYKNYTSKRTKGLIELCEKVRYKIFLDATPITQRPSDVFPIIKILRPDLLKNMSIWAFKSKFELLENKRLEGRLVSFFGSDSGKKIYQYYIDNGFPGNDFLSMVLGDEKRVRLVYNILKREGYLQYKSVKNEGELNRMLREFSTVLKKEECLDLPEKTLITKRYSLSTQDKKNYNELVENMIVEIDGEELSAENTLVLYLRMQQLISNEARIDELLKHIDKISTTDKVVIFTRFKDNIRAISDKLRCVYGEDSTVTYFGETTAKERAKNKEEFAENKEVRFFVANTQSAGLGLNLVSANYVIFFNKDFNYRLNAQAPDRIYRIGQDKNCTIISMIANGTIDEEIEKNLNIKKSLSARLLNRNELNTLKV